MNKMMPPNYFLAAIICMLLLALFLPVYFLIPAYWNLTGLLPVTGGLIMTIYADIMFHRAKTSVIPFTESSCLVTGGLYRFSRNPMYLGFVLILVGLAFLLRALSPFAVIVFFTWLIQSRFIKREEQMLANKFGDVWQAYRARVRRWF
ncbi:MAG: isoprenylcysteine carboxylmethyltransferase family protein [Anaerolineae bacterium]|nr:isoprenylcysteine carboxylmethyltransferase family protein [Anaerolineae bacterium]